MGELHVTPFLPLRAEVTGRRLRIEAGQGLEAWGAWRACIREARGREHPWLPVMAFDSGVQPWCELALPSDRGLSFSALWSVDEAMQPLLVVTLLRALCGFARLPLLSRSAVLLSDRGEVAVMPPFTALVDEACRTWDDWQLAEYCIGGVTSELGPALGLTALRLAGPVSRLSDRWPELAPLDDLVRRSTAEVLAAPGEPLRVEAWRPVLEVLEDQLTTRHGPLAERIARHFTSLPPTQRWG